MFLKCFFIFFKITKLCRLNKRIFELLYCLYAASDHETSCFCQLIGSKGLYKFELKGNLRFFFFKNNKKKNIFRGNF